MKGFKLDESGDVSIRSGEIEMTHGAELTMQTIKSVLGTQKGEWFLNHNEGINHDNILGKKRYVSKKSDTEAQYIKEIIELKRNEEGYDSLNERLARRLDGED